jgi:curved DNA-binding protein
MESKKQTLTVNGKNIRLNYPCGNRERANHKNSRAWRCRRKWRTGRRPYTLPLPYTDDAEFKRTGSDLHKAINLDLYTAVLGGEITADTLSGKVKLKVAAGTQSGTKVKLKGKGVPVYKKEGQFGDLYITYNVQLPTNLSAKQRELFEELAKS